MIDSKIQGELRKKYNPDGSDLRILQLRMLKILKYIDTICRENGITYWLSSGTCLGAVRHGGFIPWDDDVDIEMLEDDYKKFCEVMQRDTNSRIVLQTLDNDSGYNLSFGKIRDLNSKIKENHNLDKYYKYHGCFIDVFSLIPSNSLFLSKAGHYLKWKELRLKFNAIDKGRAYNWLYSILKGINKLMIPIIRKMSGVKANGNLRHSFGNGFLAIRNIQDIIPVCYINFEGETLPIPANPDQYLKKIYGSNYNVLPDKREVHMTKYKFLNDVNDSSSE